MKNNDLHRSGIYQLKFSSGHFYVGQSANVIKRWRIHRRGFKNGHMKKHHLKLFNIWTKYGEPEFQPLVFCDISQMTWLEQHLITANWSNPKFANTNPNAATSRGVKRTHIAWQKGKKFTTQHRQRLSDARKEITGTQMHNSKLSEDQVREIRAKYSHHKKGYGSTALGKEYGVSHRTILYIIKGERYGNVI